VSDGPVRISRGHTLPATRTDNCLLQRYPRRASRAGAKSQTECIQTLVRGPDRQGFRTTLPRPAPPIERRKIQANRKTFHPHSRIDQPGHLRRTARMLTDRRVFIAKLHMICCYQLYHFAS
jgi:hypothetical protein